MTEERTLQIKNYQEKTDSNFTDYTRFEGSVLERAEMKAAFISGQEYNPQYSYPKLVSLHDDEKLRDKKTSIYEAVLELEAAKLEPGANLPELEIYGAYHELRLKRIMLVEAARNLGNARTSGEWEVAVTAFSELNKEVYGEFDASTFQGMMATEKERVSNFAPQDENSLAIKAELEERFASIDTNNEQEKPLMDEETLSKLHDVVIKRYENILAVIPDTDDDVVYDAEQCAAIMNDGLNVGGLSEKGWEAVVDSNKSNPATNSVKARIFLPSSTRRNAKQLRRLMVHEQEDHARRGQNGIDVDFEPLKKGTADYADVEEGLGVLLECAIDGTLDNPAFDRARDRYITAGLALGADGKPRDARQVYEILWRTLAVRNADEGHISESVIADARNVAYGHVENAFRGTGFWMQGVVYLKLKVYYEGLKKNADYITENADNIEQAIDNAMIGKYNHTDPAELGNILAIIEARKA